MQKKNTYAEDKKRTEDNFKEVNSFWRDQKTDFIINQKQ